MKYCILDLAEERNQFAGELGEISPFDAGIPLFDCSDSTLRQIYYYRWHVFCKHIREVPDGYVITEFYPPVPWAGKYNTINCPAAHHLYEGRWLHESKYTESYSRFWFTDGADRRKYSFPAADSVFEVCKVKGDFSLSKELYCDLKENYFSWEKEKLMENGLFYQTDGRDGMEYSAGGSGCRPTINSYMYADAAALSEIAQLTGNDDDAKMFGEKACALKEKINMMLWDENAKFYKTLAENKNYTLTDMREEIGYVPWCYGIPGNDRSEAWKFLNDENHFFAPYGPVTTERIYPDFMKKFDHECLWNGPSWPFATCQTLTALAKLLHDYDQNVMRKGDYCKLLHIYANSQYDRLPDGRRVPYIDENLDPFTGEWIARKLLCEMKNPPGGTERGAHYNHSTFCDLVIGGLCGLRARTDDILEINPLFEENDLDYICCDGILYHGHYFSVLWDKDGKRYGKGKGLHIFCGGKEISSCASLSKIKIPLM